MQRDVLARCSLSDNGRFKSWRTAATLQDPGIRLVGLVTIGDSGSLQSLCPLMHGCLIHPLLKFACSESVIGVQAEKCQE